MFQQYLDAHPPACREIPCAPCPAPPPRVADADTSHITLVLYQSQVPLTQKGIGLSLASSSRSFSNFCLFDFCFFLLSSVFILYCLCFSPIFSFSGEQCVEFLLTFLSSLVDFHKDILCKLSIFCLGWFGFLIPGLFKSCISHRLSNDFVHSRMQTHLVFGLYSTHGVGDLEFLSLSVLLVNFAIDLLILLPFWNNQLLPFFSNLISTFVFDISSCLGFLKKSRIFRGEQRC